MNAPFTLAPTTGILLTAMQSGMSHIDAASEFVDNSFGPAAGNADSIVIVDARDAMIFLDQGRGVSDINLLFRIGDGNSRNSGSDIGRFGVGSKFGALTFGRDVEVRTVYEGVYHEFRVNWGGVLETKQWPKGYSGSGKSVRAAPKAIRNGGTMIIVRDMHEGKKRPRAQTYVKELGLRFQVSLLDGKDIVFCRASSMAQFLKGKLKEEISIANAFEAHLDDSLIDREEQLLTFSDSSLDSEIMFGKLRNGDKNLSGIHIAYGGRTVEEVGKLVDDNGDEISMPGRFFARIILGDGWKSRLNYNKTAITDDRDLLLLATYSAAKELIKKMANDENSEVLEKLATQLTNMLSSSLGQRIVLGAGNLGAVGMGQDIPGTRKTDSPVSPDNPNPYEGEEVEPESESGKGDTHDETGGLFNLTLKQVNDGIFGKSAEATLQRMGRRVECEVRINVDKPLMKSTMLNNPANRPATMLVCLTALADHMVKNPMWIDHMFDEDQASDIRGADQIDQFSSIYDDLVNSVKSGESP